MDRYSNAVEIVMKEACGDSDSEGDLDSADFDAMEYINLRFPNQHSLESLDAVIRETDERIGHLDDSISEVCSCRGYAVCFVFFPALISFRRLSCVYVLRPGGAKGEY